MAALTVYCLFLFFLCYLGYGIISRVTATRRFNSFARQHGCKKPLIISDSFVTGLKRLRRLLYVYVFPHSRSLSASKHPSRRTKQTGEDFLDDIVASDYKDASTVKLTVFDGSTSIGTVEPANLQAILATQFKDFEVGKKRHNAFGPLLGRTIFSSDGAFWEHSRALLRPQFSRDNINDLEMTHQAADELMSAISPIGTGSWTDGCDLMPLLYNFTLDTATHFLFGESIAAQVAGVGRQKDQEDNAQGAMERAGRIADAQEFASALDVINVYTLRRMYYQRFAFLGDGLEYRRAIRTVRKLTEHFVQRAYETRDSHVDGKDRDNKCGLLYDLATQTQDRTELRNQILAVLLAGRGTTAEMLGWCLTCLALHPDIFTKLRDIVRRDFEAGKAISFAALKSCRYLQHFMNEVLRLHPTVPVNLRMAVKDTTLPVGGGPDQLSPVAVRKGQSVLFSVYVLHRRKDLWGADALEFKPERWERRHPTWQYLPFLGGPRICLGQQFSLTEAGILLVRLLQEFDAIEPVDRAEMARLKKGFSVTMWPASGVKVRFHKASV